MVSKTVPGSWPGIELGTEQLNCSGPGQGQGQGWCRGSVRGLDWVWGSWDIMFASYKGGERETTGFVVFCCCEDGVVPKAS